MVSERVIRTPRLRVEEAVTLDLWASAQGIRTLEVYRSLEHGDEHAVALVEHDVHGHVIMKSMREEHRTHGWDEPQLYRAILRAQRDLGVESFCVPEPVATHRIGAFSVFFYYPLQGRSLSSNAEAAFQREPLLRDIHRLIQSPALQDLPGTSMSKWWAHLQSYLVELMHSGLEFTEDVYMWANESRQRATTSMERMPRALIHGDFHASNLIKMDDGRIGVIDWEFARAGHGLEDYAALHLECLALGEDPSRILRAHHDQTGVDPVHTASALNLVLAKQLFKRIAFARIRREDQVLETDYLRVLSSLVGEPVVARNNPPGES